MLVRIVKMIFREDAIETFQQLFESRKELIRNFEGCNHLELWQDKTIRLYFLLTAFGKMKRHLTCIATLIFLMIPGYKPNNYLPAKPEAWSVNQKVVLQ